MLRHQSFTNLFYKTLYGARAKPRIYHACNDLRKSGWVYSKRYAVALQTIFDLFDFQLADFQKVFQSQRVEYKNGIQSVQKLEPKTFYKKRNQHLFSELSPMN